MKPSVFFTIFLLCLLSFSACGKNDREVIEPETGVAPEITRFPEDATIFAEENFTAQMEAKGTEPFEWSIDPFPEGMKLDAKTGKIDWTPRADQAGRYTFVARVRNLIGSDQDSFVLIVKEINPPIITSTARTRAIFGIFYTYQVHAEGTPPITFSLSQSPPGMTIDTTTGLIGWQPTALGDFDVEIVAINNFGQDQQPYKINVERNPDAPTITSNPPLVAYVNFTYQYSPEAEGATPITWRLDQAPIGMSIDSQTGVISWAPSREQVGYDNVVTLRADNAVGFDIQPFSISVPNPDTMPPLIVSVPPTTARESELYTYEPQAIGAQPITWSLDTYPNGMTIDPNTGKVEWTPKIQQIGLDTVAIDAENAFGKTRQSYIIDATGRPPEITSEPPVEIGLRLDYSYAPQVTGTPPFFWDLSKGPEGMTIDPQTGVVSYFPLNTGAFDVIINVFSAFGQDTQPYTLNVVSRPDLRVDPDLSEVILSKSCLPADGQSLINVIVIPRDPQGTPIGPFLGVTIEATIFRSDGQTVAGTFIGPVVDLGDGTYLRELVAEDIPFNGFVYATVTLDQETTELNAKPSILGRVGADPSGGTGGCPVQGSVHVRILDEVGNPIPNAFVMIGSKIHEPFQGNVGFTQSSGDIVFSDPALNQPYDLTIGVDGYRWQSLFQVAAGDVIVPMTPYHRGLPETVKVRGNLDVEFEKDNADIFFGFGLPAFTSNELISADIDHLLAPGDFYTIAGQEIYLFGNTTLPEQKIATDTVKIDYQIPFLLGPVQVAMVSGSMPITDFVAIATSAETNFFLLVQEVLAAFTPLYAGFRTAEDVIEDVNGFDISLQNDLPTQMRFDLSFLPSSLDPIALSGMRDSALRFFPTGMQISDSDGSIFLPSVDPTDAYEGFSYTGAVIALDFLGQTDQKSVIQVWDIPTQAATIKFDDFYKPPKISISSRTASFTSAIDPRIDPPPPSPDLVLSVIELVELVTDPDTGERFVYGSPIWETMSSASINSFTLPTIPSSSEAGGFVPRSLSLGESYRWRVRINSLSHGPAFDFNLFRFNSYNERVTHASENTEPFRVN